MTLVRLLLLVTLLFLSNLACQPVAGSAGVTSPIRSSLEQPTTVPEVTVVPDTPTAQEATAQAEETSNNGRNLSQQQKDLLEGLQRLNAAANYFEDATFTLEAEYAKGNSAAFSEYLEQMEEHLNWARTSPDVEGVPEFKTLVDSHLKTWEKRNEQVEYLLSTIEGNQPERAVNFQPELLPTSRAEIERSWSLQKSILDHYGLAPEEVDFRMEPSYFYVYSKIANEELKTVQAAMYSMMDDQGINSVVPQGHPYIGLNEWSAWPVGPNTAPLDKYLDRWRTNFFYCYASDGTITLQSPFATICPVWTDEKARLPDSVVTEHPDPSPTQATADTFKVTNAKDDGPGSLRQAIRDAKFSPGTPTITFDIAGNGPHTIKLSSSLNLSTPVVIDGYTQPGARPNSNDQGQGSNASLKIELDGSEVFDVIRITGGKSIIRGLIINRGKASGIRIDNLGGNVIEGNFIGTDVAGKVGLGNAGSGILIFDSPDNHVGGQTVASKNVISDNGNSGVTIMLDGSTSNVVDGNFIGTDVTGSVALGNKQSGVSLASGYDYRGVSTGGASNNLIGGTDQSSRNIISGNQSAGVFISGRDATGNIIQGNYIGPDVSGAGRIGNGQAGVVISGASANVIGHHPESLSAVDVEVTSLGGNLIAGNAGGGVNITHTVPCCVPEGNWVAGNTVSFNSGGGVSVSRGAGNAILANTIVSNDGLAIDLRSFADQEARLYLRQWPTPPVLTDVRTIGETVVQGLLQRKATSDYRVEFFLSSSCYEPEMAEPGGYLGWTRITTDADGSGDFTVTFPVRPTAGQGIISTVTDSDNTTSAFSNCLEVASRSP